MPLRAAAPTLFVMWAATAIATVGATLTIGNCASWTPGSTFTVNVTVGEQLLLEGCSASGVDVTFSCDPGSSVELRAWDAPNASSVTVVGGGSSSWVLTDVKIIVNGSSITAASGPAVGIFSPQAPPGGTNIQIVNVTISIIKGSRIQSLGGGVAALQVSGADLSVTVVNLILVAAEDSVLEANTVKGGVALIGVFLSSAESSSASTASFSGLTISMESAKVSCQGANSSIAGLVFTGPWQSLSASGIALQMASSTVQVSSGGLVTAVGGLVGSGSMADLSVSASSWVSQSTNIAVNVSTSDLLEVAHVAVLGGVVSLQAQSAQVTDTLVTLNDTTVQVTGSAENNTVTAVAGGFSGVAANGVLIAEVTLFIQYSDIAVSSLSFVNAAAAIAGGVVCTGITNCNSLTQVNTTAWIGWSRISFNVYSNNTITDSQAYTACAAIGIAGSSSGQIPLVQQQINATLWIGWSTITMDCYAENFNASSAHSTTAVAGVAAGYGYSSSQLQQNVTAWIGWSNLTTNSSGNGNNFAYVAATVTGVAWGSGPSQQKQITVSVAIVSSNITVLTSSLVTAFSATPQAHDEYAYSAGSLVGVACGSACSQLQTCVSMWFTNSSLGSSSSGGLNNGVYLGSAIGGLASPATPSQTQSNVTMWIGRTTISSSCTGNAFFVYAASCVGGVTGTGGGVMQLQDSFTAWVHSSNISSTGTYIYVSETSYAFFVSTIFGIASTSVTTMQQLNTTLWIGYSTLISFCDCGAGGANGCNTVTSAVTGLATRQQASSQEQKGIVLWVFQSYLTSNAFNGEYGSSAVVGIAQSYSTSSMVSSQVLDNVQVWFGWSSVECNVPREGYSYYAVAVLGITSTSFQGSMWQQQRNTTAWIVFSSLAAVTTAGSYAQAAAAGIGLALGGGTSASQLQQQLTVLIEQSSVTVSSVSSTTAASALAGLAAIGATTINQTQRNVTLSIGRGSSVSASCSGGSVGASAVSGVAANQTSFSNQLQENIFIWLNDSSTATSSCSALNCISAIIGSAAMGLNCSQTQASVAVWIGWSSLSSTVSAGMGDSATASIGMAVACNGSLQMLDNGTVWIGWSIITAITIGNYNGGGSSNFVTALPMGIVSSGGFAVQQQQRTAVWVGWSSLGSVASSVETLVAAVIGIAAGCSASEQLQDATTSWIGWSVLDLNGPGATAPSSAVCAVLGLSVGNTASLQQQNNVQTWLAWSNISSGGPNPNGTANAASAVLGVAAGESDRQLLTNVTVYAGWSNISSISAGDKLSASSILGMASGITESQQLSNVTFWVGWCSNVTGTSFARSSCAYSASAVLGAAGAKVLASQQEIQNVSAWVWWSDVLSQSTSVAYSVSAVAGSASGVEPNAQSLTNVTLGMSVLEDRSRTVVLCPYFMSSLLGVASGVNVTTPSLDSNLSSACASLIFDTGSDSVIVAAGTTAPAVSPVHCAPALELARFGDCCHSQTPSISRTPTPNTTAAPLIAPTTAFNTTEPPILATTMMPQTVASGEGTQSTPADFSPYCPISLSGNLFVPLNYSTCCSNFTAFGPAVVGCVDALVSCAALVNFSVSGLDLVSVAFGIDDRLPANASSSRCGALMLDCMRSYVQCIENVALSSSPLPQQQTSCPWLAALASYERQAQIDWVGSVLQADCELFVLRGMNSSGCSYVTAAMTPGEICQKPSSAPLSLGQQVALAAGLPIIIGETEPGTVPSTGLVGLAVRGEQCLGCERYVGGLCHCDLNATYVSALLVYSGGMLEGAPGDVCAQSLYRLEFCAALNEPNASTSAYVESDVALQLPVSLSRRQASAGTANCVSGNPTIGGACACPVDTTPRRLPLATASTEGYVVHANFTFCALPDVTVMILASVGGGCLQPLGDNYTCECAAVRQYVSTDVAYYNETAQRYEAGVLVICGAVQASSSVQSAITTAGTLVVGVLNGPAAGLIQGASVTLLLPCGTTQSDARSLGAADSLVPFSIPGTAQYSALVVLLALTLGVLLLHKAAVGVLLAMWVVRRGRSHPDPELPEDHRLNMDADAESLGIPEAQFDVPSPVPLPGALLESLSSPRVDSIDDAAPHTQHDDATHRDVQQPTSGTVAEYVEQLASPRDGGDAPIPFLESPDPKPNAADTPCDGLDVQHRPSTEEDALPSLYIAACAKLRFPSLSLKVAYYAFQGVTYESLLLIRRDGRTAGDILMGCVGLVFGLAFLGFVHWYGTMAGRNTQLLAESFVPYERIFARVPAAVRRSVLPVGFWRSNAFTNRFGETFTSYEHGSVKVMPPYGLWRALILSILVVIDPSTALGCEAILIAMACVFFSAALLLVVMRPHRIPEMDVVAVLTNVLSGLLALAMADLVSVRISTLYLIILYSAVASVVLEGLIRIVEIRVWQPRALDGENSF